MTEQTPFAAAMAELLRNDPTNQAGMPAPAAAPQSLPRNPYALALMNMPGFNAPVGPNRFYADTPPIGSGSAPTGGGGLPSDFGARLSALLNGGGKPTPVPTPDGPAPGAGLAGALRAVPTPTPVVPPAATAAPTVDPSNPGAPLRTPIPGQGVIANQPHNLLPPHLGGAGGDP